MSLPLECSALSAYTERADMGGLCDCSRTWPDHLAQPAPPASRDHWLLIKSPASLIMRLRCFLRSVSSKDWVDGPVLIKEKCPIRSLDSWMFNKSSQLSWGEEVPLSDGFQLINLYTGFKTWIIQIQVLTNSSNISLDNPESVPTTRWLCLNCLRMYVECRINQAVSEAFICNSDVSGSMTVKSVRNKEIYYHYPCTLNTIWCTHLNYFLHF